MLQLTEIIHRLQSGDRQAAGEFLFHSLPHLKLLSRRALRAEHNPGYQTQELVNETWVRRYLGWCRTKRVACRDEFYAWISHAMGQVLIDDARRRRSAKRTAPDTYPSPDFDPEFTYRVEMALRRLETRYPQPAKALRLWTSGGYTVTEIGKLMDLPDWRVRRCIKKAQNELRRSL